jgi:uncharacterized protein with NRDE domain
MCLLVFALRAHPDYSLILAGNRDERHARAAAPAAFWPEAPQLLAGRDLEAGGTWLGVTAGGRYAVITNYRDGLDPPKAPRSRGELTTGFLTGDLSAADYLHEVQQRAREYGAFGLLCGDRESLHYYSNRGGGPAEVEPGIHGLSNHLLDTPWPKVRSAATRMKLLLETGAVTGEALFRLLADRTPAADDTLPDTGIGLERERLASATFMVDPDYGTRCSTLLLLHRDGGIQFAERRFDAAGESLETRRFQFAAEP